MACSLRIFNNSREAENHTPRPKSSAPRGDDGISQQRRKCGEAILSDGRIVMPLVLRMQIQADLLTTVILALPNTTFFDPRRGHLATLIAGRAVSLALRLALYVAADIFYPNHCIPAQMLRSYLGPKIPVTTCLTVSVSGLG